MRGVSLTFEDVAALVGLFVVVGGALAGLGKWLFGKIEVNRIDNERLRAELAAFRTEVAKEYVSTLTLERLEERLLAAIERIGDRLDKAFDSRRDKP